MQAVLCYCIVETNLVDKLLWQNQSVTDGSEKKEELNPVSKLASRVIPRTKPQGMQSHGVFKLSRFKNFARVGYNLKRLRYGSPEASEDFTERQTLRGPTMV